MCFHLLKWEIYLRAYVINSYEYIDYLAILRCCMGRDEA